MKLASMLKRTFVRSWTVFFSEPRCCETPSTHCVQLFVRFLADVLLSYQIAKIQFQVCTACLLSVLTKCASCIYNLFWQWFSKYVILVICCLSVPVVDTVRWCVWCCWLADAARAECGFLLLLFLFLQLPLLVQPLHLEVLLMVLLLTLLLLQCFVLFLLLLLRLCLMVLLLLVLAGCAAGLASVVSAPASVIAAFPAGLVASCFVLPDQSGCQCNLRVVGCCQPQVSDILAESMWCAPVCVLWCAHVFDLFMGARAS